MKGTDPSATHEAAGGLIDKLDCARDPVVSTAAAPLENATVPRPCRSAGFRNATAARAAERRHRGPR